MEMITIQHEYSVPLMYLEDQHNYLIVHDALVPPAPNPTYVLWGINHMREKDNIGGKIFHLQSSS
jgi:hypothetical protein